MPIESEWSIRLRENRETISALTSRILYKDNLIDAMKIALAIREDLIEDTFNKIQLEKKTNLQWIEFGKNAVKELAQMRELAEKEASSMP